MTEPETKFFFQCPACGKHFDEQPTGHGQECLNGYDGDMIKRTAIVAVPTKPKRKKIV